MHFKPVSCYIIDDEAHCVEILEDNIERTPWLECLGFNLNPLTALEEIRNGIAPDILFLDVNMPQISGIDLIDLLPGNISIILVTGHYIHAVSGFEKEVAHFLLKPFSFEKFLKCVNKIRFQIENSNIEIAEFLGTQIFVNSGIKGQFKQVIVDEISYFESSNHNILIYAKNEKHSTRISFKELQLKLTSFGFFVRVHRAFIINMKYIDIVDGSYITIIGGSKIPIGSLYKEEFMRIVHSRNIKCFKS